ncbi:MAG: hypothetical protein ABIF18_02595 [archaeon]
MVIEENISNLTELFSMLPPSVIERIEGLTVIFKAVGIAVIVYIVYVLIMGFVNYRKMKKIVNIEKKLVSMDKKLDRLLKKKKK